MNATVTVTIGRNVGDVPMEEPEWADFVGRVGDLLDRAADEVFVDAAHVGAWDGVAEESHTWVATVPTRFIAGIGNLLASYCATYKQDAIAMTVGQTTLITPTAVPVAD